MRHLNIILILVLALMISCSQTDYSDAQWALGPFKRPVSDAIIIPTTEAVFNCPMRKEPVKWMESDTFNPAATIKDGKIVILFRSEDNSAIGIGSRTSRIGYAESANGVDIDSILPQPVFFPGGDEWEDLDCPGGIEDPRVAKTEDGLYVMFYTSYNRKTARLCVATSRDLKHWEKHGPAFKGALGGKLDDEWTKSASIVTRLDDSGELVIDKINGKYLMYWGESFISPATSDDLIHWTPMTDNSGEILKIVTPREGYFDSNLTECGPPAVHTKDGIVLIYNGKSLENKSYSAGQVLFDAKDPTKVLARLDEPFFKPELPFEKTGQYVDGTVFCEGLVHHNGRWFLYYGCADSRVGVAVCEQNTYIVKGNTSADIQTMIDKAFDNGGGKVVVPSGVYNVGSLQLKSNVELHLEKGALLMGADYSEAYDSFPEDICAIQPEKSSKVLVYAYNSRNIAITGEGVIDGNGPKFFDTSNPNVTCYSKPPVERPRMVQFVNCDGIRLEKATFKDSPCWTMFIRFCRNIEVNGIYITADQKMINNDGIDFDGCSHVRVSDSHFKTCDDCLILRAMRESTDQHVICEDIIITDCELNSRCQTVRLGSPSDDVIRNALFKNIKAEGANGIFADYPTRYLNSDDEGYMDISNIVFDNYSGTFEGSAVQIVSQPGVKIRRADGFVFLNFDVKSAMTLNFIGNAGYEIGNVLLENFKAEVLAQGDPFVVKGCNRLEFKSVTINGTTYPDGIVKSEPGDNSKLVRGPSVSWEQRKKAN